MGFPGCTSGKKPTRQCRRPKRCGFSPWVGKIPCGRAQQLTPVSLPGESQGQRSLVGYSPYGRKESDTTEATQHACTHRTDIQLTLKQRGSWFNQSQIIQHWSTYYWKNPHVSGPMQFTLILIKGQLYCQHPEGCLAYRRSSINICQMNWLLNLFITFNIEFHQAC